MSSVIYPCEYDVLYAALWGIAYPPPIRMVASVGGDFETWAINRAREAIKEVDRIAQRRVSQD